MKIFCFLFCTLFSFGLVAQDNSPKATLVSYDNGLRWDQTTHDFGTIAQGTPQTAEFVLTNSGTEPLLVLDVKSSCGCTAAKAAEGPVMPGESTTILATYNAKKSGSFRKTVKVTTNKADTPIVLTLKGTVEEG